MRKACWDCASYILDRRGMHAGTAQLYSRSTTASGRHFHIEMRSSFFGGLNIFSVGDYSQLPLVLQKPLYYDKAVQGVEIKGRNAYMRFDKTALLSIVQQQRGDDQEALALGELRTTRQTILRSTSPYALVQV